MVKQIGILASLAFLISCSNNPSNAPESGLPDSDTLSYEVITMIQSVDDCIPDSGECTYIHFEYPQFVNATGALGDSLLVLSNRYFQNEELRLYNKDSIQKAFLNEFKEFRKEQGEDVSAWNIYRTLTVINQNPKWITLCEHDESYTGGAHPNSYTRYRMINKQDGRQIKLYDLLDTTSMNKILEMGETAFRSERGISPSQGLEEAGFWFPNNRFAFNDNFYITDEGFTFFYNSYEIGPYAFGPTTFTLPANKLMKYIKK